MKRFSIMVSIAALFLIPIGCDHTTFSPVPPPNPLSVTVTISGYSYPAAVTIRPGGTVCWVNPSTSFSDHTVLFDDRAGGCVAPQTILIGGSACIPFAAKGLYEYHDANYGFCNNNCTNCQGMAGFVRVE